MKCKRFMEGEGNLNNARRERQYSLELMNVAKELVRDQALLFPFTWHRYHFAHSGTQQLPITRVERLRQYLLQCPVQPHQNLFFGWVRKALLFGQATVFPIS